MDVSGLSTEWDVSFPFPQVLVVTLLVAVALLVFVFAAALLSVEGDALVLLTVIGVELLELFIVDDKRDESKRKSSRVTKMLDKIKQGRKILEKKYYSD